ncbi:hypothetical protein PIB30_107663, partial [Stylosanthes scabra]|nr:hypothetical protein [Stylosanthes scabra]
SGVRTAILCMAWRHGSRCMRWTFRQSRMRGCGLSGSGHPCGPTRPCEGRPREGQFPRGSGMTWTSSSVQKSGAVFVGSLVTRGAVVRTPRTQMS